MRRVVWLLACVPVWRVLIVTNRRDCACDSARPGRAVPTRYGRAIAQVDAFFDQTGGLWTAQKLNGKMATILTGTGTQVRAPLYSSALNFYFTFSFSMEVCVSRRTRSALILILGVGQETTVLTTLPFLVVSF